MATTYVHVDFPPPPVTGPACQACEGRGVTGEQYQMQTGGDRVLLVDVFCLDCGGCGSAADLEHQDCTGLHAWDDAADRWDDDAQVDDDACPSCLGREWNAVTAWPTIDTGIDAEGEPFQLRVPCGCTTTRARVWTVAAEQEGL